MKPNEFVEVAAMLRSASDSFVEGRERSAVSRYYYAAFLEAREKLIQKRGFRFKKYQAHEYVKRAFYFADEKRVKRVGRLLGDLKDLREAADYSIGTSHDPVATGEAGLLSQQICSELEAADFDFSACVDPDAHS